MVTSKLRIVFAFVASLVCVLALLAEDIGELFGWAWVEVWEQYHIFELALVSFLFAAMVLLGIEVYKMWLYTETMETKLSRASEAFEDLLSAYFDAWELSDAEQEVTRLLLKGCSVSEMAQIRNSKEGTIKAQTNAIYKKSGYANKTQLLSAFLEDLTNGGSVAKA